MSQGSTTIQFPKRRDERRRLRGTTLYVTALAVAAVAVAALVVAGQVGGHSAKQSDAASLQGVTETAALLAGIPQHGNVLGAAKAPVTLVEYADLQCPYCGEFARDVLPTIVRTYVRTGKVKLVFRGLAFVGPDSETALRAMLAAGASNRLWQAMHLIYVNQGAENSGWVTPEFLRGVADAIHASVSPGSGVTAQIGEFERLAAADEIRGTPTFFLGRSGGSLRRLRLTSLDPGAFRAALDTLLR